MKKLSIYYLLYVQVSNPVSYDLVIGKFSVSKIKYQSSIEIDINKCLINQSLSPLDLGTKLVEIQLEKVGKDIEQHCTKSSE
ncbi:Hypothetical predicted protein [Octopus vulgaris]|uniref:Uncharacterized protein n=1 Tax=Octopus vulgaris TaxID=6645 RepID=A0AA36F5G5_OCTVU|nr:Hypothetical predicted protein [Octopus vulgaris]